MEQMLLNNKTLVWKASNLHPENILKRPSIDIQVDEKTHDENYILKFITGLDIQTI